jgi:LEM3 (ligand-effect modulator 3) family / CDC50 family
MTMHDDSPTALTNELMLYSHRNAVRTSLIHCITSQYLHESFPEVISPLDGVKDEHFIVWMRVAGLRQFRKPYGRVSLLFAHNAYSYFLQCEHTRSQATLIECVSNVVMLCVITSFQLAWLLVDILKLCMHDQHSHNVY